MCVIFFNIFDILGLENGRIGTKIKFVSCLQPEIRKVMQKGIWPWYSGSCNEDIIFFIITFGFLDPENIAMRNIFKKFWRGGKNPGDGIHLPWAFSVGEIPWLSILPLFLLKCRENVFRQSGDVTWPSDDCRATVQWLFWKYSHFSWNVETKWFDEGAIIAWSSDDSRVTVHQWRSKAFGGPCAEFRWWAPWTPLNPRYEKLCKNAGQYCNIWIFWSQLLLLLK